MKKTILWILSVGLIFLSIGAFSTSVFSGLYVLLAGLLCNPLVLQYLEKTGWKPKRPVLIIAVIALFFTSLFTSSGTEHRDSDLTDDSFVSETLAADVDSANVQTTNVLAAYETESLEDITAVVSQIEDVIEDNTVVTEDNTLDATFGAISMRFPKDRGTVTEPATEPAPEETTPSTSTAEMPRESSSLEVHFIDVGQGDATLIKCDDEYMLIDAGDNDKGTFVQNYLNKQGVDTLTYVIGTHPDADHYGGLDVILYKFDCETVLLPDEEKDTATYRDVMATIKEKRYKVTSPVVGDTYSLGGASFTILSPAREYEDVNDSSIAILLTHGENTFLFTGDCEGEAEKDMLSANFSLSADVYKAGHHGSYTSSSEAFLDAVNPTYAVISCGEDNSYGHPHAQTLNNLRIRGISVFRTDEQGSIIAESDGKVITFNCAPSDTWKAGEGSSSASNQSDADITALTESASSSLQAGAKVASEASSVSYVVNTNTGKFHYPSCVSAKKISDKNRMESSALRDELVARGYSPCRNCKP